MTLNNVLTSEQLNYFNVNGFLVIESSHSKDLLDSIIRRVQPFYGEDHEKNPTAPARVQDAWKKIDQVRRLATDPRIIASLHQLMGRKPLPFQTLNFPIGTRQATHSDTIHFNTIPSGFMVGVWVALEDIDMNNGPLIYYPGSHKLPVLSMQDLGLETGYENYKEYEEKIQKMVEDMALTPQFGTIKKGQALIWHANLLHGGYIQKDLSRSRHSQVTHYYFEGCEYYTPMVSSPEKIAYRQPDWIPSFYLPNFLWNLRLYFKAGLQKLGVRSL